MPPYASLIPLKDSEMALYAFDDDCLLTGIEVESALPHELVKLTFPVLATLGTVAVIWVLLFTVNLAGVSPNLTEAVPVRLVPVITKLLFIAVEALPKFVTVGAEFTVKATALLVPFGVVTITLPEVALAGIVKVILVDVTPLKAPTLVPFMVTDVAPVKAVPVIETVAFGQAELALKVEIIGD